MSDTATVPDGIEMVADSNVLGDHGFGWVALHPYVDERTFKVKFRNGKIYGGEKFKYRGDPGKPPQWAKATTPEGAKLLNDAIAVRMAKDAEKAAAKRQRALDAAAAGVRPLADVGRVHVVEVAAPSDIAAPAEPPQSVTSAARQQAAAAGVGRKAVKA